MADPAEDAIGHRHQGDKGEHHRADRNRQLDPGLRALPRGHDDIGGLLTLFEPVDLEIVFAARDRGPALERQFVLWRQIVGHDQLGHQYPARRRHERGGKQERKVFLPQQPGISGEDRPRDPGHADGHQREHMARRKRGEIGAHDQRTLGLADEDIGCCAEAFDAADPGDPADPAADPAHHALHDAEIIENRHQRREEHDHRQCEQGEILAERVAGQRSEQEFGALAGVTEQIRDAIGHALDHRPPARGAQHEEGDHRLQRERRADHAQADCAAVGREQDRDEDDRGNADDPEQGLIHRNAAPPKAITR